MKSYEELLEENKKLKQMNQQLKMQIFQEDFTKFPWFGNLGHWYWDYQENIVDFNPLRAQALGFEMDEIPAHPGFQFFTEKIHKADYDRIMNEMVEHLKGNIPVWEVKYRIQSKDGSWRLYYDRGKVTQRSPDGQPLFLTGIVFDITEDDEQLTELMNETEYWRMQAQFDSLTHLYSRFELVKQLEKLHQKTRQNNKPFSLYLLDIDGFKQINDNNGHRIGDKILNHLGRVISKNLRSTDFAGRYGGDEFIIAFPDTDKEEALNIVRKIQTDLEKLETPCGSTITISGGIVSNDEEALLQDLIELADKRLYQAKKGEVKL